MVFGSEPSFVVVMRYRTKVEDNIKKIKKSTAISKATKGKKKKKGLRGRPKGFVLGKDKTIPMIKGQTAGQTGLGNVYVVSAGRGGKGAYRTKRNTATARGRAGTFNPKAPTGGWTGLNNRAMLESDRADYLRTLDPLKLAKKLAREMMRAEKEKTKDKPVVGRSTIMPFEYDYGGPVLGRSTVMPFEYDEGAGVGLTETEKVWGAMRQNYPDGNATPLRRPNEEGVLDAGDAFRADRQNLNHTLRRPSVDSQGSVLSEGTAWTTLHTLPFNNLEYDEMRNQNFGEMADQEVGEQSDSEDELPQGGYYYEGQEAGLPFGDKKFRQGRGPNKTQEQRDAIELEKELKRIRRREIKEQKEREARANMDLPGVSSDD